MKGRKKKREELGLKFIDTLAGITVEHFRVLTPAEIKKEVVEYADRMAAAVVEGNVEASRVGTELVTVTESANAGVVKIRVDPQALDAAIYAKLSEQVRDTSRDADDDDLGEVGKDPAKMSGGPGEDGGEP